MPLRTSGPVACMGCSVRPRFQVHIGVLSGWRGKVELSPAAFLAKLEDTPASQLLGVEVNMGEIVEIDDGLKSCCFYLGNGNAQYLPYWDSAKARQNVYQPESAEE